MIDPTARIFSDPATPRPEARSTQSLEQPRPFREQLFESFATAAPARKAIPDRAEAQKPRTDAAANSRRDEAAERAASRSNESAEPVESYTDTPTAETQATTPPSGTDTDTDTVPIEESSDTGESPAVESESESDATAGESPDVAATDAKSASKKASTGQPNAADALVAGAKLPGTQAQRPSSATPASSTTQHLGNSPPANPLEAVSIANQGDDANAEGEAESHTPANSSPKADNANATRANNSITNSAFTVASSPGSASVEPSTIQPNTSGNTNAASPNALTTSPADGSDALNEARLTRGLRSALNQQGGSVTLRLTPPEMGTVRIQMQLQGTQVTAQFHAETDAARSMLQQQLGQLRSALEGQGLSVERLGVQTMSGSNASNFNGSSTSQQNQNFSQNPQDPGTNADGRSRGFFQQSRDPHDTPSRRDAERRDSFADLVGALN